LRPAAAPGVALVLALALALAGCGPAFAPVRDAGYQPEPRPKVVHIVRRGDTLYSIAFGAGLDYRAVARWNGIAPPYVIKPGQKLRLRPPPGYQPPTTTTSRGSTARGTSQPAKKPASQPARKRDTTSASGAPAPSGAVRGWMWPAQGPILQRFSPNSANPGIDIGGQPGQSIRSAADGRVVYSGDGLRGYGQLIIVKHNETFLSAYAHNRKLLVREGDRVRQGQPIAEMGATGTNRVKLHFEIRKKGTAVDPLRYLPKT